MKQLFLSAATLLGMTAGAQAADMAAKAPYYKTPVIAVYDWTGFYLGVNAGIGLGRDRTLHNNAVLGTEALYLSPQGALGGGQVGYNWQTGSMLGPVVYGLEADIQGAGLSDGRTNLGSPFLASTYNQRIDWFGTIRGRIGLATGPVLSYVTGGYAYGKVKTSIAFENSGTVFSTDKIQNGWVVGSGVEAALGGNWTGKIEYLYLNMGNNSYAFGSQTLNTEVRENIFRVGLNYRVGGSSAYAPVVAANWTGWYLGGNFGSGTGRDRSSIVKPGDLPGDPATSLLFNLAPDGVNGGLQLGYNWQTANWVYGLEADIQASSQRDNKTAIDFGSLVHDARLPWFGTVRGRLGYSVGSTLFYATGGYAYGSVKTKINEDGVQVFNVSTTKSGWTAGAGIETPFTLLGMFGPNWTSKTEYLYVDLGTASNTVNTTAVSTSITEHVFRTGLNYHFNNPVLAKY
ncbi:hypothetical protein BH11PSE4_BH11PSE4_09230 [soil metagenome]